MTIVRDGKIVAFFLEEEIVCLPCSSTAVRKSHAIEDGLTVASTDHEEFREPYPSGVSE